MILVVCALLLTGVTVRRELFGPNDTRRGGPEEIRLAEPLWDSLRASGHVMGSAAPKLELVAFSDFECPACRRFATQVVPELRSQLPDGIRVVYRHWTLGYHRFAIPAARAAECADAQGRFEQMHEVLFAGQDSLGLKTFPEFARDAGIPDSASFAKCVLATEPLASVAVDTAVAIRLGGIGTPLVIANGVQFRGMPSVQRLLSLASE